MKSLTRALMLALMLALATPLAAQNIALKSDPAARAQVMPDLAAAMNSARAANGLRALQRDAALEQAAAGHARDMARQGYFDHRSKDGRKMGDRIRATGFKSCLSAENIAFGQRDSAQTLQSWMKSAGHRRNILLKKATHVGAARAVAGGRSYWVAVFAKPC